MKTAFPTRRSPEAASFFGEAGGASPAPSVASPPARTGTWTGTGRAWIGVGTGQAPRSGSGRGGRGGREDPGAQLAAPSRGQPAPRGSGSGSRTSAARGLVTQDSSPTCFLICFSNGRMEGGGIRSDCAPASRPGEGSDRVWDSALRSTARGRGTAPRP